MENCRAIYVLSDHVIVLKLLPHIEQFIFEELNDFFQVLELASKIKPQERPSSSPSETWQKKSLCASSCRFWKRLSSFDSMKQAAILKLNHMVLITSSHLPYKEGSSQSSTKTNFLCDSRKSAIVHVVRQTGFLQKRDTVKSRL